MSENKTQRHKAKETQKVINSVPLSLKELCVKKRK